MNDEDTKGNGIELTDEGLRHLAVALLDAIPNGDPYENISTLATFNTNLLAGLLFGGARTKEAALDGLDAYVSDVRKLIENNFDAAKEAMEQMDKKN